MPRDDEDEIEDLEDIYDLAHGVDERLFEAFALACRRSGKNPILRMDEMLAAELKPKREEQPKEGMHVTVEVPPGLVKAARQLGENPERLAIDTAEHALRVCFYDLIGKREAEANRNK